MFAPEAPKPPFKLYEVAELLTGPVSGFRAGLAGAPFVGAWFQAPEILAAREFMESWKLDFSRALQQAKGYPVKEMELILNSLDLESKFLQEPQAFKDKLVGLDDFLKLKQDNAAVLVASPTTSKDLREAASNIVSLIQSARDTLGVPPKMTEEEALAAVESGDLKPGMPFRLPSGKVVTLQEEEPKKEKR